MYNEKKIQGIQNLSGPNMAPTTNKSQMFILPNPDDMIKTKKGIKGNKYRNFKAIELVLMTATLFALLSGQNPTEVFYEDLLINVFIGFSIAYPLLHLIFRINVNNHKMQVLGVNSVVASQMVFISYLILKSWYELKGFITDSEFVESSLYYELEYYLSSKFFAGVSIAINSFVYTCESLVLFLEINGVL